MIYDLVILWAGATLAVEFALILGGFAAATLYGLWQSRLSYVSMARVEAMIGPSTYRWESIRQAVVDAAWPAFIQARADKEPEMAALSLAMSAAFAQLGHRSAWWRAYRVEKLTDPAVTVTEIETAMTRMRVENITLKKDLAFVRQTSQGMIAEMQDLEAVATFLVQEQDNKTQARLPYLGGELDEVRVRMGQMKKVPKVSVDDLLIDASQVLKWIDELQSHGTEPPPAVYQLKRHIAAIPAWKR